MGKNTVLAVVLSSLFVIIVLYLTRPPKNELSFKENNKVVKKKLAKKNDLSFHNKLDKNNIIRKIDKTKRIFPLKTFDASEKLAKKRIKDFVLTNKVYKINFTSLDASIKSLKLLNYKNDYGNPVDSIFYNDPNIFPLATSFVSADQLRNKLKSVYLYGIYNYESKSKNLKIFDKGSLGNVELKNYKQLIFKKTKKMLNSYQFNKEEFPQNIKIVFFRSEYFVNSEDKKIELIKIFYIFEKKYLIDLDIIVNNLSNKIIHVQSNDKINKNNSFYIHWGESLGPYFDVKKGNTYDSVLSTAYLDLSANEIEEKLVETNQNNIRNFKWLSLDSRYLLVSLITDWNINPRGQKIWTTKEYSGEIYQGTIKKSEGWFSDSFVKDKLAKEIIGISFNNFILDENKPSKSFHISVFVGPKTRSVLNKEIYEDFDLVKVRDRTWMSFIKPLEWGIEWFLFQAYRLTNSFGLAIIFLTIFLKIILNPLTKKSLVASTKMSQIAPKMKEIEKQYKNNREKKQKAIMELYKREKINPLGGCLPLLLQIPIFYALWNVLPSLLDLKNAHFLWIKDLSSPDTVSQVNLFLTNNLNILPLIMSASSIIQMKLTPQSNIATMRNDQAQSAKMMQYMMPIVFLFVFWSMPSGLVLYWTVQNILQIMQQIYTNWRKNNKT